MDRTGVFRCLPDAGTLWAGLTPQSFHQDVP